MSDDQFNPIEFMNGRNDRTNAYRESYCKLAFCKHRKKHKCAKHHCRIVNATCDPMAEYMRHGKEK